MSQLNFLEKLLKGTSVEWKMLGEVAEKISSGGTPSTGVSEYWENGKIPWMSSGEVNLETVYKTEKYISETGLKNSSAKLVPKNSIVIALAGQGKTRGKVARIRIELTTNQSLASLTFNENQIDPDYVFHFLKTQYDNLRQISAGSETRGGLNLQMISGYKLPVPPLPVQVEIVRILDAFTELTTELTARKKQYNYYRDQLLNFDEGEVEWKTVEDIFDLRNGYTPSKSISEYWKDGTIPWFRMEDIRENGQILNDALQKVATNALKGGKLFPANSIIVATSATIGEHALITVPYLSNQRFTNLILKTEYSDRFEIKFLFYYCFLLDDWCKNNTTMSSFASVDMNGFRNFQIPIPPPRRTRTHRFHPRQIRCPD
ncbi:type I restriction modification DNA specificity domain protein [Leptospira weilii serovar Topaz str. LT2116]|uniref:Type I restriction modification DNA specificity domain protein n=1 Tax=Leptospira weilii serovar Topaz str. LT2116 TaxID=1088540 RepID=M3EFP8_9LEPT|nr:type I restriction modification DNA specificity domain protein [Leptospira weilii serovar Topaz str. LT2116]